MESLELFVANVKCGGCDSNVETGLKSLEDVESVTVNIPDGKTTVSGTKLDQDAIIATLSKLGYPETGK